MATSLPPINEDHSGLKVLIFSESNPGVDYRNGEAKVHRVTGEVLWDVEVFLKSPGQPGEARVYELPAKDGGADPAPGLVAGQLIQLDQPMFSGFVTDKGFVIKTFAARGVHAARQAAAKQG